jgi:predicted metal-dependent peptidase
MNKNYYPLLKDFISKEQGDKIFETEAQKVQKIEDMDAAISPYTGKTINVKKVKEDIEKAKYKIVTQSPLYRPYIHEMTPTIYTWLIETMGTDGVRLFVNPEFADNLSWMGKIFVLVHEIYHCILMHAERGEGFDQKLFNVAGDFEINTIIVDTTDDFDEKFVKEEIHGLYDSKYLNIPVEQIYRDLLKNPPNLPPQPKHIEIDTSKIKKQQGTPPPQPPSGAPPQTATLKLGPGSKVRIKSTGQKGVVTKVNADGTFEVDPINENLDLFMLPLLVEGYKREDLIPILPGGGQSKSGGGGPKIQDEYETEEGEEGEGKEGEGKEGEGKEDKGAGQGSGDIDKQKEKEIQKATGKMQVGDKGTEPSVEDTPGEQKRLQGKMQGADRGNAGGIIDTRTGEQIARASGYDEDEIRAGEDARTKWEGNAREMVRTLEKQKQAGSGRGDALIGRLKKILKPEVDWKTKLKMYVGSALSPEKYYRIGAKKHLYKSEEYLKRGLRSKKDAMRKVVVAIDVSGSMFSGNTFDRIIGEVNGIIFAKKIKEITVIFFDDGVDPGSVQVIKRGTKVWRPKNVKGGGGTDFQKPLDWIKSHYNDAINLCIFLTDGYASNPAQPSYHRKFIWVVYDNDKWQPPFGKAIKTTVGEM